MGRNTHVDRQRLGGREKKGWKREERVELGREKFPGRRKTTTTTKIAKQFLDAKKKDRVGGKEKFPGSRQENNNNEKNNNENQKAIFRCIHE